MEKTYKINDWLLFLNCSRSTLWRYIKKGKVPKPATVDPTPRWEKAPSLNGFQPNQNTSAS